MEKVGATVKKKQKNKTIIIWSSWVKISWLAKELFSRSSNI